MNQNNLKKNKKSSLQKEYDAKIKNFRALNNKSLKDVKLQALKEKYHYLTDGHNRYGSDEDYKALCDYEKMMGYDELMELEAELEFIRRLLKIGINCKKI